MISQAALEEAVLTLLCYDDLQAPLLSTRIDVKNLSNRVNQTLAKCAINYIQKYTKAPGVQLEYLLEDELRRGEEGKLLGQTIDLLAKQAGQIDPQFVLNELDRFLEVQAMSKSCQRALEALGSGDVESARSALFQMPVNSLGRDDEIWLNDPIQMLSDLDTTQDEFFSTGIPSLDEAGVQLARKELAFLIAPAKFGKSWWLIEVGKAGLQYHHKVLHITNELSEKKTARRYLQAIFGLTKAEAKQIRTPYFEKDATGAFKIEFRNLLRESVVSQRRDIQRKLREMTNTSLIIKHFPTGMLTVEDLSMYMELLKKQKGFVPDILIVDYADLMKIDASSLRIDTGRLYRELRGLGDVKNCVVATATQGNRESATARVVDTTNVAEDWSKVGTGDLVLTYSRTPEEKKLGLARILVAAARDAADRFMVMIAQSYETGQFCLGSEFMSADVILESQRVTGG